MWSQLLIAIILSTDPSHHTLHGQAGAAIASPGGVGEEVRAFGRIEPCTLGATLFIPDDSRGPFSVVAPGFEPGDQVFVTGTVVPVAQLCDQIFILALDVDGVEPAFAGCGTLMKTARPRLLADDGRTFLVSTAGGFPNGAELFVRGIVTPGKPGEDPMIEVETIDACFSATGRLEQVGGCSVLRTTDGQGIALENTSDALPGSFIETKGVALEDCSGFPCVGSCVAKNTIASAFGGVGRLTEITPTGSQLDPNIVVGFAPIAVENPGGFDVGDEVFVLGPATFGINGPVGVSENQILPGYSGFGAITGIVGGRARFEDDAGRVFALQSQGDAGVGDRVFVTGILGDSAAAGVLDGELTLNTVNQTFFGESFVQLGFECSPLGELDGQLWTIRGLPSATFNTTWIVEGVKRTACPTLCPFACFGVTRAGVLKPERGDMNCDGVVSISDINGFVLALTDADEYAAVFPLCNIIAGDFNGNGQVGVTDINGFVDRIVGD